MTAVGPNDLARALRAFFADHLPPGAQDESPHHPELSGQPGALAALRRNPDPAVRPPTGPGRLAAVVTRDADREVALGVT